MKNFKLHLIVLISCLSPAFIFANNTDPHKKLDSNEAYTVRVHLETASGDYTVVEEDLEKYMNCILFDEKGDFVPLLSQLHLLTKDVNLDSYKGELVDRYYFEVVQTSEKYESSSTLSDTEMNQESATLVCHGASVQGWGAITPCNWGSSYCIAINYLTGVYYIIACQSQSQGN